MRKASPCLGGRLVGQLDAQREAGFAVATCSPRARMPGGRCMQRGDGRTLRRSAACEFTCRGLAQRIA
ncbi:hypothetical protein NB693_21615 [Pantoea ananatis]|uniref:hypothetical protein n=1 Tax=Pantoea ananas TaxID=553 RepID=UPI00221ECA38|nr:hypothetical protein [Pantoea ananatis]